MAKIPGHGAARGDDQPQLTAFSHGRFVRLDRRWQLRVRRQDQELLLELRAPVARDWPLSTGSAPLAGHELGTLMTRARL